jgi:UDP-N-acetylmuramoyl-tripeptide--D-alanyl-D-alanine ligase
VTGSNGKTTAKEMISSALSSKFKVLKNFGTENNHIGVPNTLLRLSAKHQAAVIELGTNHRGEISYLAGIVQPTIGVITNIGPSHLKYLKSLSGVYEEKISLLKHLKSPAIAILNADDQFLSRRLKPKPGIISLGVGLKQKTDFSASFLESADEEIKFRVNKGGALTLPLLGSFNVYNALLAIACGRILGLRYNDIARMLARFKPPEKRLNLVNLKGVSFINDCYNANPLSLGLALDVFNSFKACGRKIAVIGDMLELGSREKTFHIQAGRRLSGICDYLICVGKRSRFTAASAEKAGLSCDSIFTCESSSEAREVLFGKLSPVSGDVVLLKGSRAMKLEEVIR